MRTLAQWKGLFAVLLLFGGVGALLRFLVSQPSPVAFQALERLYAMGDPEGRAYALAGLKKLNPDRFKELFAAAEDSTESVVVMHGCFASTTSLGTIACKIDWGDSSPGLETSDAGTRPELP